MSAARRKLLETIAEIGGECSPSTIDALAAAVVAQQQPSSEARLSAAVHSPAAKGLARRLARAWAECGDVEGGEIAVGLQCAGIASTRGRSARKVELAWTGPSTEAVPVRRTDRVLVELVQGARERILIVSFAAYKIAAVIEALQAALDRGVRVDLVLESATHSDGKLTFDAGLAFAGMRGDLHTWIWPAEMRPVDTKGNRGALHAKCAVADSSVALVTSANLTEHALESNMELGVRIEGGPEPAKIDRHFRVLMERGVLKESSGPVLQVG